MARKKAKKPAPKKKRPSSPKQVESVRHKDKRKNIPTEELRGFVSKEEQQPTMVEYEGLLYARDPSLDPQLVWKGKDEQDREPLTVPAVPVYIQEKVHPQAIVEEVKAQARQEAGHEQLDLFADFNNLPAEFSERVDFYHHEANWSNRMILGDSLLVMTSLAEKEALKGQIQTIYIDPPYGINFDSNWQVSTRRRDVTDGKAEDATRQPEQIRAFRDTWRLGIHSYLSYWRDRLIAARELLTETGSVFVQIGDENVHLVRCVLDEVFGAANVGAQITFQKTTGSTTSTVPRTSDYLLWYAKDMAQLKFRKLFRRQLPGTPGAMEYKRVELADGSLAPIGRFVIDGRVNLPEGARVFMTDSIVSKGGEDPDVEVECAGKQYVLSCKPNRHWKTGVQGVERLWRVGRLLRKRGLRIYKRYLEDFPYHEIVHVWSDTRGESDPDYVVQTHTKVIERCILMTTDPGDLVLDPTCGSGTTAYVAEQWGRRWVTIDTSRVSLALARTRLMAARYPYYLLADSPEGQKKEAEVTGRPMSMAKTQGDVKKGFVYERVPHIMQRDIAHNEEIDDIHARWQERLEPIREQLNEALGQDWEEWQVPHVLDDAEGWKSLGIDPKSKPAKLLKEWWDLRQKRQAEIDASIARVADQEILYDRPYEDGRKVRVTGPLTVESLSPHRTISVEEKKARAEEGMPEVGVTVETRGPNEFGNIILENLKKAGVQNTIKNERLRFDTLDPFPGQWIHGEGRYTEKDGTERRAAICIGPEHGTVGGDLIREAAKEAVQGVGFDVLIVCGFAFDPAVNEETKRYGKLVVLPCRMNADLAMGDEFLKKTGSANLFMVFGEPDLAVERTEEGKITVEVRGVDIYDPTTGEIRSNATDDIACWFIDTNYNGESFFVRHAYFCGADRPYDKLKRALRAEIDEAAWETLYRTESRPFDPPATGKIAVKVINHYGDEVLRVYEIGE